MKIFRTRFCALLILSGLFRPECLFAQKVLLARQFFAEKSKIEIAGLLPRPEGADLLLRCETDLYSGKKKFQQPTGKDLLAIGISSSGDLREADMDSLGMAEDLQQQPKKTAARNGNFYFAYCRSSAVVLPQNSDWSLAYQDGNQNRLWDVTLHPSVRVNAVLLLNNGNCLLGGFIKKEGKGLDLWICQIDNHGKTLWEIQKGGKSAEEVLSLAEDREGRIFTSGYCSPDSVFLGNSDDLSGRDIDGFILFLDNHGNEKFFYRQRGKGACRVEQMVALENGLLVFAGTISGADWRLPPFGFPRKGLQDVVLGIIDPKSGQEKESLLRIFPNPARETVYFSLSRSGLKEKCVALLQTVNGEVLQQMPVKAEPGLSYRFNVSNTRPGPYFIVLKSGGKELRERLQIE